MKRDKIFLLIVIIITGIFLILISSCATPKFNTRYYNQHCTYKKTPSIHNKILFHPKSKKYSNSSINLN